MDLNSLNGDEIMQKLESRYKADEHVHSSYSDGPDLYYIVKEAMDLGLDKVVITDHSNPIDPDIKHESNFWNYALRDSDIVSEITSLELHQSLKTRKAAMEQVLSDYQVVDSDRGRFLVMGEHEYDEALVQILKENYDLRSENDDNLRRLMKDLNSEEVLDLSCEEISGKGLEIVLSAELDYNPFIEEIENPFEKVAAVEHYEHELNHFMEKWEENSVFSKENANISFHHVNVGYEPLYVKNDENFTDFSQEEKREVIDHYFDKLGFLVESDLPGTISHVPLIERNKELMEGLLPEKEYENPPEERREVLRKVRPELSEYYLDLVNVINESDKPTEINGKGAERVRPISPFYVMLLERGIKPRNGSDAHREGEMTERKESISRIKEKPKNKIQDIMQGFTEIVDPQEAESLD